MSVHDKNEDRRPDIAKDDTPKPRENVKDKWHNPTETMSEGPAGSPNATDQSRKS
ncbi:hypothetical protein [Yoonia sp. 208BN28-4]|uniref:hypothetical protein n=1 Tax=Yoonia sp. 208BN28-4 TaxID=3126505 RepID=UPI0030B3F3F3